jgi:hypothetical protein
MTKPSRTPSSVTPSRTARFDADASPPVRPASGRRRAAGSGRALSGGRIDSARIRDTSPGDSRDRIRDNREGADLLGFPEACPDDACRRTGRCRGAPRAFRDTGHPMLPCIAALYEDVFGPVDAFRALCARVEALEEILDEQAAGTARRPARRGGGEPGPTGRR